MKRLLSINNYGYPRGGAENVFLAHNELFREKGWGITPFYMKHPKNEISEYDRYYPIEIEFGRRYSTFAKLTMATKVLYSIEARRKIGALLKDCSFDICHCHNIYHHISPSILSKIKLQGIPLVMTLHDLKMACPNYQMMTHDGICERCRGGRYFQVLLHRCIKNSMALSALIMIESYLHHFSQIYSKHIDRFIVPSMFYRTKLIEWGMEAKKIVYIPNFVESKECSPECRPGKKYLYFGRLAREKGVSTLISAASIAGADLLIAGIGPEMQILKKKAQNIGCKAEFLEFINGENLQNVVRSCRATILPSEWYENAPLSIKESYALGKPVIGARIGGIPELIREGETGITFQSGSVEELAEALVAMSNMPDQEVERMGKAGRMFVERNFSRETYLERMSALYDSLMK